MKKYYDFSKKKYFIKKSHREVDIKQKIDKSDKQNAKILYNETKRSHWQEIFASNKGNEW